MLKQVKKVKRRKKGESNIEQERERASEQGKMQRNPMRLHLPSI